MTIIDLSEQIDDICSRYPEYWLSDEAQRELQTLWGGADCNDCGVFERDETIRIDLDGQKSWYGELRIAVAPNGWHAIATSYWYGQGGGGSAPSVWNRTAYTDARRSRRRRHRQTDRHLRGRARLERLGAVKPVRSRRTHDRNAQSVPVADAPVVSVLKTNRMKRVHMPGSAHARILFRKTWRDTSRAGRIRFPRRPARLLLSASL